MSEKVEFYTFCGLQFHKRNKVKVLRWAIWGQQSVIFYIMHGFNLRTRPHQHVLAIKNTYADKNYL